MKKILSILLILLMICTTSPIAIANESDFDISSGKTLRGYSGTDEHIVIPDGVTSISNGFYKNTTVKSIIIPNSVKSITGSFTGCTNLEEVIMPEEMRYITQNMFKDCTSLKKVTLPKSFPTVPAYMFSGCASLEEIEIPEGIKTIRYNSFENCTSLKRITLPSTLETIEWFAFDGCTSLEEIVFPDSVWDIGGQAFRGCSSLTEVIIPATVTKIGGSVFKNCENLKSIIILNPEYTIAEHTATVYSEAGSLSDTWGEEIGISFSVLKALPTTAKVLVNGIEKTFDAYNIAGSNYFKLRDIAAALNGSAGQFEVAWDSENSSISLYSGYGYTAVGGELSRGDGAEKEPHLSRSEVYKDGEKAALTAFTINDNNYFKLRDIGKAFDLTIGWDEETGTVTINTL